MKAHAEPIILGLIYGIGGFVAFFAIGSITESGLIGIAAFCIASFFSSVFHCRRFPRSVWYTPLTINLPLWLLLAGPADPGQFQKYFLGLSAGLVLAYIGAIWTARTARLRSSDSSVQATK